MQRGIAISHKMMKQADFMGFWCSPDGHHTGPYAELNVGRFFSRKSGPF